MFCVNSCLPASYPSHKVSGGNEGKTERPTFFEESDAMV